MTHAVSEGKLRNSTVSAFWFTLILVAILIAALNFVHSFSESMKHENEHHATTEAIQAENTAPQKSEANHEASATTEAREVQH